MKTEDCIRVLLMLLSEKNTLWVVNSRSLDVHTHTHTQSVFPDRVNESQD